MASEKPTAKVIPSKDGEGWRFQIFSENGEQVFKEKYTRKEDAVRGLVDSLSVARRMLDTVDTQGLASVLREEDDS